MVPLRCVPACIAGREDSLAMIGRNKNRQLESGSGKQHARIGIGAEIEQVARRKRLIKRVLQGEHSLRAVSAQRDHHTQNAFRVREARASLHRQREQIAAGSGGVALDGVLIVHPTVFQVRWIPDDHVEPAAVHDAVEFNEPMERPVAVTPLPVGPLVIGCDAVVAGHILV